MIKYYKINDSGLFRSVDKNKFFALEYYKNGKWIEDNDLIEFLVNGVDEISAKEANSLIEQWATK